MGKTGGVIANAVAEQKAANRKFVNSGIGDTVDKVLSEIDGEDDLRLAGEILKLKDASKKKLEAMKQAMQDDKETVSAIKQSLSTLIKGVATSEKAVQIATANLSNVEVPTAVKQLLTGALKDKQITFAEFVAFTTSYIVEAFKAFDGLKKAYTKEMAKAFSVMDELREAMVVANGAQDDALDTVRGVVTNLMRRTSTIAEQTAAVRDKNDLLKNAQQGGLFFEGIYVNLAAFLLSIVTMKNARVVDITAAATPTTLTGLLTNLISPSSADSFTYYMPKIHVQAAGVAYQPLATDQCYITYSLASSPGQGAVVMQPTTGWPVATVTAATNYANIYFGSEAVSKKVAIAPTLPGMLKGMVGTWLTSKNALGGVAFNLFSEQASGLLGLSHGTDLGGTTTTVSRP